MAQKVKKRGKKRCVTEKKKLPIYKSVISVRKLMAAAGMDRRGRGGTRAQGPGRAVLVGKKRKGERRRKMTAGAILQSMRRDAPL